MLLESDTFSALIEKVWALLTRASFNRFKDQDLMSASSENLKLVDMRQMGEFKIMQHTVNLKDLLKLFNLINPTK